MITRSFTQRKAKWLEQMIFPFLSLPPEIRQYIYIELLVSFPIDAPTEPLLLWHDRNEREETLSLYPQILRTSKQINAEATTLLYERNKFQFSLTSCEPQCCGWRDWPHDRFQALIRDDAPNSSWFHQPGLLTPVNLRRLAHIEIVVAPRAVWANKRCGDDWSCAGGVFMGFLQLLADADEPIESAFRETKKLVITVEKETFNGKGWVLFPRGYRNNNSNVEGEKRMAGEICPLVEAISEKRDVRIFEVLEERERGSWEVPRTTTTTREVFLNDFGDL